ncbi:virginiamycin A acetyltransferase [Actinosynnema pretiosum]|nr:CatB-related O-acetyltransferase [Actinosynnema pretiosum]MCP2094019.1 virginiamycin A acetyltransferase [Actinosynnema pretiosum]
MTVPDPNQLHPMADHPRVVLLKPLVDAPNIEVGDYTYYDDPERATEFQTRNVLYSYGPERLVIGKYCALGTGTTFIMAGANHLTKGPSTFPFTIFGGAWAEKTADIMAAAPSKGDTVVGNDVWFGCGATVMPGVTIGDGAIIATGAVVTSNVAPYTVVGGNPAQAVRQRYPDDKIELLLRAAWWDWPVELVTEHVREIMAGKVKQLADIAEENGLLGPKPR